MPTFPVCAAEHNIPNPGFGGYATNAVTGSVWLVITGIRDLMRTTGAVNAVNA